MSNQSGSDAAEPGPSRELPEAFTNPVENAPKGEVVYQSDADSATEGETTDSGVGGRTAESASGGVMTDKGPEDEATGTPLERGIVEEGSAESFPASDPPSTMPPTTLSKTAGSGSDNANR